jgi:hypothetical protein
VGQNFTAGRSMISFAQILEGDTFSYYFIALAALFLLIALSILPRSDTDNKPAFEAAFLVSIAAVLYAWRWPTFFVPYALNPDEGIWVAGALKAKVDALPWRGFDGQSSGPLSSYVLMLPALFGANIDFFSARVIAVALMFGALCAIYYALKWNYGARVARLAMLPPVLFLSLTIEKNFVHFSSEHLPIVLITIGLAVSAYLFNGRGTPLSRAIAGGMGGLSIGSVAFAKLQALPLAAAVLALLAIGILALRRTSPCHVTPIAITTFGSLCCVPIILLLLLSLGGELTDAITSYVKMAFVYIADHSVSVGWRFFLGLSKSYTSFLVCSLIVIVAGFATLAGRPITSRVAWEVATAILLFVSSWYVIYQPHRYFAHYLLFSIIPLTYCLGTAIGFIRASDFCKDCETPISLLCAALFLIPPLSVAMSYPNPFVNELIMNPTRVMSEPAKAITRYAGPGSRIVIWGWMPEYYVQTSTVMATRDAQTGPQIVANPYQDYFRQRFMSDILKQPPLVFVDAVAPGSFRYIDRATQGHEIFPQLDAFISEHYTLKEDVAGVRIYTANGP